MNETQLYSNGYISLPVRQLPDGKIEFDVEQAAIGLGITQIKNCKVYVQWKRVNNYLNNVSAHVRNVSPQVQKGDFISESQFYKLAIKANNETAEKFQNWVTNEVLPSIRQTGMYATRQTAVELLNDPDSMITLLTNFSKAKQERDDANAQLQIERDQRVEVEDELTRAHPKLEYVDNVLQSKDTVTITVIAKEYGMSAVEMNKTLHNLGIQFKVGGVWVLYSKYQDKGYTKTKTVSFERTDGRFDAKPHMEWTQKGRQFLYDFLKQQGIWTIAEQLEMA